MQRKEDKAVARLAEIVALECGVHPAITRRIRTAAALHDIGKQKIPGDILSKPGKLSESEMAIMKTHTTLGAEMLSSIQGDIGTMVRTICLYHHEWYNGKGYWGIYADELPVYVSIVGISDVFFALISERPYKDAWPPKEACDCIQSQAGTQFSPELVRVFLSLIYTDSRIPAILDG
jgi:putative two-component system response regulator